MSGAVFDRMVEKLEVLTFKKNPTREEKELAKLMEKLIEDYDDTRYAIPQPFRARCWRTSWSKGV